MPYRRGQHSDYPIYGYDVDPKISIAYIVLFSLNGLIHLGQSIYHRVWWLTPTFMLCPLVELLGWIGRYWSSQNNNFVPPFLMQICCTIIAPSFMAAGLFFILGTLTNRLGFQYVYLAPKRFSILFIFCDVISLFIQAAGGATASIQYQNGKDPEGGARIMVGGIIFQIVAITLYVGTATEFIVRYRWDRPVAKKVRAAGGMIIRRPVTNNLKQMILGMVVATILLYVRSVYRTIELMNGWTGSVIHNQALFNYMDAFPILLALFTLNVFNPGRLLFGAEAKAAEDRDRTVVATPVTKNGCVPAEQKV